MMQAHASTNISDVHTAVNSIIIRHVQPVSEVQTNSVTTPSYGGFNSATNPIVDPMVTMMTKMASLDLDPGTFLAAFGGAASIGVSTFAPPGMHHYGPPQTYHNGRYSPTLLGMLRPSVKDVTTLIPMNVSDVTPITSASRS